VVEVGDEGEVVAKIKVVVNLEALVMVVAGAEVTAVGDKDNAI